MKLTYELEELEDEFQGLINRFFLFKTKDLKCCWFLIYENLLLFHLRLLAGTKA